MEALKEISGKFVFVEFISAVLKYMSWKSEPYLLLTISFRHELLGKMEAFCGY